MEKCLRQKFYDFEEYIRWRTIDLILSGVIKVRLDKVTLNFLNRTSHFSLHILFS